MLRFHAFHLLALRLGACALLASSQAAYGQAAFDSPVKLFALAQRADPVDTMTDQELDVLKKFDLIAGLDGHGYNFPGAINRFRARGGVTPVLCSGNTMDIQADITNDTRFKTLNRHEDAFLHTADPASLRSARAADGTHLWFKPDFRNLALDDYDDAPKVTEYVVEYASTAGGIWHPLTTILEAGGVAYYFLDRSGDVGRFYRVRSRMSDGSLWDYSWPTPAEEAAEAWLGIAVLGEDGSFTVGCLGEDCPQNSGGAVLVADLDNDRFYGTDEAEAFYSESYETRGAYTLYHGRTTTEGDAGHFSYRAALSSDTSVRIPGSGESYTLWNYNNRLQNLFASMLVKPGSSVWRSVLTGRLRDCMTHGFSGMRLDFGFDDLSANWIGNALVAESERPSATALAADVAALYRTLHDSEPSALLTFNGLFVSEHRKNYQSYLAEVTGSDSEFFAFTSWNPNDENPDSSTEKAMLEIINSQNAGKISVAIVGSNALNRKGRIKSLVLYLLVAGENSYYGYDAAGDAQHLSYFPEWDAPLGDALATVRSAGDIQHASGLLAREFRNGWVLFNSRSVALQMDLGRPAYRLNVSGGNSPVLGGDGTATYDPVGTHLVLQPGEAAIVTFSAP